MANALTRDTPATSAAASSGGTLTAVLGLDDTCRHAADWSSLAEGKGVLTYCALGAVQHSVQARLAGALAPEPAKRQRLNQSRSVALQMDAEDSVIILAARYFAGHTDNSISQHSHPQKIPNSWRHSQEQWNQRGHTLPAWTSTPTISVRDLEGHERATIVAPLLAVVLMIACVIGLCVCQRTLGRLESEQEKVKEDDAVTDTDKEVLKGKVGANLESSLDFRLQTNSAEVNSTPSDKATLQKSLEGTPLWFWECFRFATWGDMCAVVISLILAGVHGACMPIAFYQTDRIFRCIYMPNDDGSLPPVKAPHVKRDEEVWNITRIYLLTAVVASGARFVSLVLMSRTARRQTRRCRLRIFETLLRQDPAWHDLQDVAEMTSRVSMDTFYFQQGLAEKPLNFFRSIILTCSALAMAMHKDWKLALVMAAAMPVSVYGISVAQSIMESHKALQLKDWAKAGAIVETATRGLRTVFAYNGQEKELERYQEKLITAEGRGNHMGLVTGFSTAVNFGIVSFAMCLGVYAGSIWILEDYESECWVSNPPFGTCLTGGTMMGTIFTVMWGFSMGLGTISESAEGISTAKSASQRIFAIIDAPASAERPTGRKLEHVKGDLSFESLVFSYPGRPHQTALNGISLRIPSGSTYALVGPSGSGKSTIVSLILHFYRPTSGRILLDGEDTQELDAKWMRSKMALVEQEPPLFGGTIYENILYGSLQPVAKDEVQRAAKMANAHDFISQLPAGYETDVGERGGQLSGGQKQRIAIARSLIRDPTVMILDEATSALDSASEKMVQDAMNKLMQCRSRTMIIIAHRLSTIRTADQICVMESGKLVEQGTHENLLTKSGLYCKLAESQMQGPMREKEQLNDENQYAGPGDTIKEDNDLQSLNTEIQRQQSDRSNVSKSADAPLPAQALLELEAQANVEVAPSKEDKLKKTLDDDLDSVDPNWNSRLWQASRPEYGMYFLGILCICLSSLTVPWYMMHLGQTINLFNRPPVILVPDTQQWAIDFDEAEISVAVSNVCFIMQFSGAVVVWFNVGSHYLFNKASEALIRRLRTMAFGAILRQEISWHDERPPGILTSRLSEQIPKIKLIVGNNLALGFQAAMGMLFGLTLALIFSWKFTLSVLGVVPLLGIAGMLVGWAKFENENLFGGMVSESLCSIKTVTAFDLEPKLMKRFKHHLEAQGDIEFKASLIYGSGMGTFVFGFFVLLCLDQWFAVLYVNRGDMSQDRALVVFFCIMASANSSAQAFSWMGDRAQAKDAALRFFALIDRKPVIDNMSTEGKQPINEPGTHRGTRIEFEAVHFHYPSRPDVHVFKGFSLVLEPNTVTAIVGPSGAGKSTAVALLQRFYDPQAGVIRFNGDDILQLNISWLRSQMGLVQQEPVLFAGTILENIKYGALEVQDADVMSAARAANAHGFICNLPDQYLTDVGNRGAQMSGGQKQRIAIARALARKPSVLLLDEATAALDTASERQVQEALDELLKVNRQTTLIIAHRLSTIQNADKICVVNNGQIEQSGTHLDLLKQGGLYSKLVGSH